MPTTRPSLPSAATSRDHPTSTIPAIITFLLQRLLSGALVLLSIMFLSYFGLDMAGGMPFQQATSHAGRQTLAYLNRLSRFDLGMSGAGSRTLAIVPVIDVVKDTTTKSLGLMVVSLTFATLIGVGLGIWAAKRHHTAWSLITLLVSITGVSVPSFFAALLLQLGAIQWTKTFGKPLLPVGGFGWDERIILPALVLAARPIAQIARVTFVSVSDVLDQDFVRTAQSKGLASRIVMSRHVMRNVAIPILTTVGVSLRFSLSSLPLVEFFFSWPGTGFMLLKAISQRDDNLTVALVLCLGALFILVNLVLESAYRLIDPRLRQQTGQARRRERENILETLRSLGNSVNDAIRLLWKRLRRDQAVSSPSPFRGILQRQGIDPGIDPQMHHAERRRAWVRGTVSNLPFVIGSILVMALFLVVFVGPHLAPHSPYTTRGLEYNDGKLTVPPFAPSKAYPFGTDMLGRDVMSLILSGAQQTLLLTALVVSARMLIGILLGALAGWHSGGLIDRALLRLAEIISAFPTLLLAMTLILALGIQQGLRPFILALCFVGWSEVMQFVRGEVMTIQPKPFIESAVASGLRTPRIILTHVLPNLLPSLISIAALEMGAALMLLGELGFVGIFIGGGAFAELDTSGSPFHYSDVPEWGALLSNIRLYARAYPWMAIYPTSAFFLAIWGFNLLGEGVRRMIETVGVGITKLINRYTVAAAIAGVLIVGWAGGNTGSMAFFRQQAATFDAQQAMAHVQALTDPALQGRALGTPGYRAAAEYVEQQFRKLGLQPAGETISSYFQTRTRSFETLDAVPRLQIDDLGEQSASPPTANVGDRWVYRQDYAEHPGYYRNLGLARAPVRVIALSQATPTHTWFGGSYKELEGLDVSEHVVMVFSAENAFYLRTLQHQGLLVVAQDESTLRRPYTLSSRDPTFEHWATGRVEELDAPALMINQAIANRILENAGYTVRDIEQAIEALRPDQRIDIPTETTVSIEVQGTTIEKVPAYHVLGHMPGRSSSQFGGIDNQVIVVLAQYDSPPLSPDGALYPGANDNASGVAVMLEAARTMQSSGYQPYRTFVFIAYSGEGQEGGMPVIASDVSKFLQGRKGFATLDVQAIVHLRGLGAGDGDRLMMSTQGSMRLAKLFEDAAKKMNVRTQRAQDAVDISIVFEDKSQWEGGQEAAEIFLSWQGWDSGSHLPTDSLETISQDRLGQAGQTLTLALMVIGHELNY
ncbi:MAG: ABC transporter permease subunit [Anaerolineae bacterium]|nr:ABC transporter permease subunit [Anaerolineae bacterium]